MTERVKRRMYGVEEYLTRWLDVSVYTEDSISFYEELRYYSNDPIIISSKYRTAKHSKRETMWLIILRFKIIVLCTEW
jgi:hypothetical protein